MHHLVDRLRRNALSDRMLDIVNRYPAATVKRSRIATVGKIFELILIL